MRCEVVRESEIILELTIFVNGSDSRIDYKISDTINWAEPNLMKVMLPVLHPVLESL